MDNAKRIGCPLWAIRLTLTVVGLVLLGNLFFYYGIGQTVNTETTDVVVRPQPECDCSHCPKGDKEELIKADEEELIKADEEELKKADEEELKKDDKEEFKVPNIVHYTWYADESVPMTFKHYIGVLSASKVLKPDKIFIHMNITRPAGDYWDKIIALPNVEPRNEGIPQSIWDQKIVDNETFFTDYSDISRLKYLLEYGGIYLDYDVFVIRSFDELRRKYDFTLGQEQSKPKSYELLSNGVIITSKDSPFLALWGQTYEDDYQPRKWVYNACFRPTRMWKRFPQWIHVETDTIHQPNWREIDKHWGNETFKWRKNYAVHNYYRFRHKAAWYKEHYGDLSPDEEDIKTMKNTYAVICRWILSL